MACFTRRSQCRGSSSQSQLIKY